METEVLDYDGTLLEAIQQAVVPMPPLLTWPSWLAWRATEGRLPPMPPNHERSAWMREEVQRWTGVLRDIYGADFRQRLRAGEGSRS